MSLKLLYIDLVYCRNTLYNQLLNGAREEELLKSVQALESTVQEALKGAVKYNTYSLVRKLAQLMNSAAARREKDTNKRYGMKNYSHFLVNALKVQCC